MSCPLNAPLAQVHNNQRDGLHRQATPRGRVAYEPNSLAGGCPFQAGATQGFVTVSAKLQADDIQDKVRAKPEKFADNFTQATLFYESQTPVEQAHIAAGFRFELSKVTVPAIRERTISMLRNASESLAQTVAAQLGMQVLPDAMSKALESPETPEITHSPALSLMFRPGEQGIKARKIALLVADGVDGKSLMDVHRLLAADGAVPKLIAPRIGQFKTAAGAAVTADASFETEPGFLFDAVVLPDGQAAVTALSKNALAMEFIRNQYRHCKAILVLGTSKALLSKAEIPNVLPNGKADPGLVISAGDNHYDAIQTFIRAVEQHRNFERESDPSMV